MGSRQSRFVLTMLVFGFAFLYVPILLMVVYSFNASRLVTVWDAAHSPTSPVGAESRPPAGRALSSRAPVLARSHPS